MKGNPAFQILNSGIRFGALCAALVSSNQINGQLPFNVEGNATVVLHTPGGVSDNFNFTILPSAPGVFRSGRPEPIPVFQL
jgi:uncharacterized protein (TIGR03437 family)